MISYTSPAAVQEQSRDRGRFGSEGVETPPRLVFFLFWGVWKEGRGGGRGKVRVMLSPAGSTAELGVFRS